MLEKIPDPAPRPACLPPFQAGLRGAPSLRTLQRGPSTAPEAPAGTEGSQQKSPNPVWDRSFQPFPSHHTHTLITEILRHTRKHITVLANLTKKKKISIILTHLQRAAIVLAGVIFVFDNLREKRSVPRLSQVLQVLKVLAAHGFKKIAVLGHAASLHY